MLNEKIIAALEEKGFNRWTKGNMDRLYINAAQLGLDCDYYKSGNICAASFKGSRVSNSEAGRMKAAKTYIDIATGETHSNNYTLKCAARELLNIALEGAC